MSVLSNTGIRMGASAAGGDKVYVEEVFSTYVYGGTGSALSITNDIDISGEGGMVWIKRYDGSQAHTLGDTERTNMKVLEPNSYSNQYGGSNYISAYNSNGFSLGTDANTNANNQDYVSWTFRKAKGFFDVVTYTGDSVDTTTLRNISHNLGCKPGMILIKDIDDTEDWAVYHKSIGTDKYLKLNESDDIQDDDDGQFWGDTEPTSSVFTLQGANMVNKNGDDFVAYLFADGDDSDAQIFGDGGDESIIKMGTYTGNGSTTGPEINLGWEPQFLIIKKTSSADSWQLKDVMRRFSLKQLLINSSGGEAPADEGSRVDPTATGFAVKTSDGAFNANSGTYVYMAIRRGPMKTPEDATKVFAIDYGANADPAFDSGFTVDAAIRHPTYASAGNNPRIYSRLQDTKHLYTSYTGGEGTEANSVWNSHAGFYKDDSTNAIAWMFQRAPGFMDVTTWTGDGTNSRSVPHNLTVAPELMLVKVRNITDNWLVWDKTGGVTKILRLDNDDPGNDYSSSIPSNPTSSNIIVSNNDKTNASSNTYIAYLFASLDGISKVGSYTGPSIGNNVEVDCGFSAGARFVLIKRTDSANDWFVFDSTRGISTGSDDPYFFLNTTAAQVTDQDKLDVNSSGFTVRPNADAESGLNTNGGTYIYLAIA